MKHDANRKPCFDPARSEILSMSGSDLHGSWEISSVPEPRGAGVTGKAQSHNPVVYAGEKSDTPVVPEKPSNKGDDPAEIVEERGVAKGNVSKPPAHRTPSRNKRASMGLEGVRIAARRDKTVRFTALLQHHQTRPVSGPTPDGEEANARENSRIWVELMRRSQRPQMPWDRFCRIARRFMPPIRNAHLYPEERFYPSHT